MAFTRKLHLVRAGRSLCGRAIPEIDTYATQRSGWSAWQGCPSERCGKCVESLEAERCSS